MSDSTEPPTKKSNIGINDGENLKRVAGKFHLLIGCTGSVASIKVPEMVEEIRRSCQQHAANLLIRIVATESALAFFDRKQVEELTPVYSDTNEWNMWRKRGDPILHIELRKWADVMVIAPLDANTLAKISNGICDNLLTCVARAWDLQKPMYICPAMNTFMWENPITYKQLDILKGLLGFKEIPCIEKELMCGDKGYGAMATLPMIASVIASEVKKHFAIYTG